MRDQTPSAPRTPWTERPDPTDPTRSGEAPRGEHPRAIRTLELPAAQPRLDPDLICLYRDQRVPPCI